MPYVVVKRCPGGPNPDLVPGTRLGDRVRRTLESAGYVKWFPPDGLHKAPAEPEKPPEYELPVGETDLADTHKPRRNPPPVPPALPEVEAGFIPMLEDLKEAGYSEEVASSMIAHLEDGNTIERFFELHPDVKPLIPTLKTVMDAGYSEDVARRMIANLEAGRGAHDPGPEPTRDGAAVARLAHTQEIGGSIPSPATNLSELEQSAQAEPEAARPPEPSLAAASADPPVDKSGKTKRGRRSKRG